MPEIVGEKNKLVCACFIVFILFVIIVQNV